jgi:hypothetical protein
MCFGGRPLRQQRLRSLPRCVWGRRHGLALACGWDGCMTADHAPTASMAQPGLPLRLACAFTAVNVTARMHNPAAARSLGMHEMGGGDSMCGPLAARVCPDDHV